MTIRLRQIRLPSIAFWQQFLIVSGVVLAAFLLPMLTSNRTYLGLVIGLVLGAGAALVLIRRLEWGLILIIPAGLLVSPSIGTGSDTMIHAAILLTVAVIGLWVVRMVIVEQHVPLYLDRVTIPLLVFMLAVLVSFIAGQIAWYRTASAPMTAQIGALSVFLFSGGIFLATAHVVQDVKWLKLLTWPFLGIGACYIALRLVPTGAEGLLSLFPRGATGSVFWIWLTALAAGQFLFNRDLSPFVRFCLAVLVLATLAVGLGEGRAWASGWLPPLIGLGIILWVWKPRLGWVPALAGVLYMLVNFQTILRQVSGEASGELNPFFARVDAWRTVLEATRPSILFGLGPANYYYYVELFGIIGWNQQWYVRFNSHSQYVDIIAQVGLVGLACFLWFAAALLLTAYQLSRQVSDGFVRGYAAACVGGIVATLVSGLLGDWFLPFVYNIGIGGMRSSLIFWIFAGGLMSIWYGRQQSRAMNDAMPPTRSSHDGLTS